MADFTDVLKLNDLEHGDIHQIVCDNQLVWRRPNQNLNRVPLSIDIDGSIFNECGYIDGYRINSGGTLGTSDHCAATGFIPYTPGDIVRLYGIRWTPFHYNKGAVACYSYISFYDASFNVLGSVNFGNALESTSRGICGADESAHNIIEDYYNCVTEFHIHFTDSSEVKYVRISGYGQGKDMMITINEPVIDKKLFTNQAGIAIDTDGNIYNGGLGYKMGYRVRSGGAEAEASTGVCTGFIPVNANDIIRISGCAFSEASTENAINIADETFTNLGQMCMNAKTGYGIIQNTQYGIAANVVEESSGIWLWQVPPEDYNVSYIRVNGKTNYGHELIITVNEEIKYGTGMERPYTNIRNTAVDYLDNPYGYLGYKNGYRLNSESKLVKANNMTTTGFIPCSPGDIVRMKGINFNKNSEVASVHRIFFYDKNKEFIGVSPQLTDAISPESALKGIYNENNILTQFTIVDKIGGTYDIRNVAYFRITCDIFDRDSIITINEKIRSILDKSITNVLPLSINQNKENYIGINGELGYDINKRYSTTSGGVIDAENMCISGYIPYSRGQKIRIKNARLPGAWDSYFVRFNPDMSYLTTYRLTQIGEYDFIYMENNEVCIIDTSSFSHDGYFRLSLGNINENSIITINEKIN